MEIYYVEEFCPVDSYKCHMPVEYEFKDGKYHKVRCACHNVLDNKCDKSKECAHYKIAPDTLNKNDIF